MLRNVALKRILRKGMIDTLFELYCHKTEGIMTLSNGITQSDVALELKIVCFFNV